jgi:hypothetical protein
MRLTLILDPAPGGVRASLVEEWDEGGQVARMAPRVRLFDADEAAIRWARALASRRRLDKVYLTDNRKQPPPPFPPSRTAEG